MTNKAKKPLTANTVKNAPPKEKSYKLPDGKGLHLLVHTNGVKSWRFRYRFAGKENMLSLGNYPDCTLKEARDKCDCTRKKISDGIDPSQEKKIEKLTRHINAENSFENISREWHDTQKTGWTERHAMYVLKRIESDLFPSIGFRPINEITAPELLATVKIIEKRGALDIASRVLQTSGQIFRYAIATGRATHDISADLRGALTTRKKGHFNKLPEKELPEFLQKLEEYDGEYAGDKQTKLALTKEYFYVLETLKEALQNGVINEENDILTYRNYLLSKKIACSEIEHYLDRGNLISNTAMFDIAMEARLC